MDDLLSVLNQQAPFQWGPIITTLLAIFIPAGLAAGAWAVRRVLNRMDQFGTDMAHIKTDIAVLQTIVARTSTNVAAVGSRVGAPVETEDTQ